MKPEIELSFALRQRRYWAEGELPYRMAALSFTTDLKTQGRVPQNICLRQVQGEFSKEERKITYKQEKTKHVNNRSWRNETPVQDKAGHWAGVWVL